MKAITIKELRDYLNSLESYLDDYPVLVSDRNCETEQVVGCYENREYQEFNLDINGRFER